jgi:serine/threonine protein phosphatase PrpC
MLRTHVKHIEIDEQLPTKVSSITRRRRRKRLLLDFRHALQVKVFLILVCCFITTLFVILVIGIHPYSSSPKHSEQSYEFSTEKIDLGCEVYGCPISPIDFDSDNVQEVIQSMQSTAQLHTLSLAMMTRRGLHKNPPINQDYAVVFHPFRTSQTTDDNDFFMGIFDGHGAQGHHLSAHAARFIPEELNRAFQRFTEHHNTTMTDEQLRDILATTLIDADRMAPPFYAMHGGTTASIVLRRGRKLFFANVGDSRTVLASIHGNNLRPTATIDFVTRDDKPYIPDERARIESMGGIVRYPKDKPKQSRVWIYSAASRESIGLAMSRSIGDWEFDDVGVIPDPIITIKDLDQLNNAFILDASDGMWDMRQLEFFANRFASSLSQGLEHPLKTCYNIIEKISLKNLTLHRDDITIIAMKLHS